MRVKSASAFALRRRSMLGDHLTFSISGGEIVTKTHNRAMSSWTLLAAAVGIFALAGCNQRESAQETAKDVAEERQDAAKDVADESREAASTANQGAEDRAEAEYDVAVAQADGQRKIAKEKCETMAG